MASKAQIARRMYNTSLQNLSGGEKAAVTRAFNAQDTSDTTSRTSEGTDCTAVVEFGRPSINGVKKVAAPEGTSIGDAFKQTGLKINLKKEGFTVKTSTHYTEGQSLNKNDQIYDGDLYLIVPGVDSSR